MDDQNWFGPTCPPATFISAGELLSSTIRLPHRALRDKHAALVHKRTFRAQNVIDGHVHV
jgi:hypothetical protein